MYAFRSGAESSVIHSGSSSKSFSRLKDLPDHILSDPEEFGFVEETPWLCVFL